MTKIYCDENFPLDIVGHLRQLGYDFLTCYEAQNANQGIPDETVLAFHWCQLNVKRSYRLLFTAEARSPLAPLLKGGTIIFSKSPFLRGI